MSDLGGTFQVGIVVRNPDAMVDFYEGLLGFEHLDDVPVPGVLIKRFTFGDAGLKLLVPDDEPTESNVPGGPTASVAGLRYLTIAVNDVAGMVERCLKAGCSVPMPTFEAEGSRVAIVEDPDGNWVELVEPKSTDSL